MNEKTKVVSRYLAVKEVGREKEWYLGSSMWRV